MFSSFLSGIDNITTRQKRSRPSRFRFERLETRAMLSASGDFNGDGFDDLAVGVSGEDLPDSVGTPNAIDAAGAVSVIYGGPDSLTAQGDQFWSQNSPGVE